MKIRLILATKDREYAERFAEGAAVGQSIVDIAICTNLSKLTDMLSGGHFDICLADPDAFSCFNGDNIKMAVMLRDTRDERSVYIEGMPVVKKYQRISTIISKIIRYFADIADQNPGTDPGANISVIWSPAGGSGKTTIAVAHAIGMVQSGKTATYLDLENFSSVEEFFPERGISLSSVFDQMANNISLQLLSIKTTDSATGVSYFGAPDNYDDMNVLSVDDIIQIAKAAAANTDELVIDLSSYCDERTKALFELASRIILVTDHTKLSYVKLSQFMEQSNVFLKYKNKMTLVLNKGAVSRKVDDLNVVRLPYVDLRNPSEISRSLAGYRL